MNKKNSNNNLKENRAGIYKAVPVSVFYSSVRSFDRVQFVTIHIFFWAEGKRSPVEVPVYRLGGRCIYNNHVKQFVNIWNCDFNNTECTHPIWLILRSVELLWWKRFDFINYICSGMFIHEIARLWWPAGAGRMMQSSVFSNLSYGVLSISCCKWRFRSSSTVENSACEISNKNRITKVVAICCFSRGFCR